MWTWYHNHTNKLTVSDWKTSQLPGLSLPEQSWGKEEERPFSAAKVALLTFRQHTLPSLLQSLRLKTRANATKALHLAQGKGLREQGSAAPHCCSCTGLTRAAPQSPAKLTAALCWAPLHKHGTIPKGSPEPIPGRKKHPENLRDFRNITRSKHTPWVPSLSQWTRGSTETTLPQAIFHRLPSPTKIQVWFKATPQLRQKLNDAKPCTRAFCLLLSPELQMPICTETLPACPRDWLCLFSNQCCECWRCQKQGWQAVRELLLLLLTRRVQRLSHTVSCSQLSSLKLNAFPHLLLQP